MQIRDFREKRLDGFLKTFRHLIHSCTLKALFRYSFMNPFLAVPKRAVHAALAALAANGKSSPGFTRPPGRPTEHTECARLLNVISVGCVGRPRQHPPTKPTQMTWVAGCLLSHHCLPGPVFSRQRRLEHSAPKHTRSSFFFVFVFKQPYSLDKGHVSRGGATPKRPAHWKTRLALSCSVTDALWCLSGSRAFCWGHACSVCQASSTPRTL